MMAKRGPRDQAHLAAQGQQMSGLLLPEGRGYPRH